MLLGERQRSHSLYSHSALTMIKQPFPTWTRRRLLGGLAAAGSLPGLLPAALKGAFAAEPDFFTILTGSGR